MNRIVSFAAGFITALAFAAAAGSLSITTDAGQDARIAPAFGDKLRLGRNANASEVKADVIAYIRSVVTDYETRLQQNAIVIAPLDPN